MDKNIIKELNKNDEIEVEITRIGDNGEGIAIHNGIVIFVPFALIGEKLLVHIINNKNNYCIAKIVKILSESKDRVVAPCPYFTKCGGCNIQHINQEKQLELKEKILQNSLKKYAKIDIKCENIEFSQKRFKYRNKFAFPIMQVKNELKIGMFRKNSHDIIDINDCMLQSDKAKIIIKCVREFMQENKISGYNEETKSGIVKHIVMREHGDKFILTVVVCDKKFNNFEPLIEKLKKYFNCFGLYKNINLLHNNVIFGEKDEHIYGLKELEIEEFGIKYFVNNRSFMQINDDIKNLVYEKILELVGENKIVIDAYSGAGLLSSIIAKHSKHVYGIEIIKEATENANNLKDINNLYNLTNKNGDCAIEIPKLVKEINEEFVVVVDPPRKGLDKKVVDTFLNVMPSKIIYLSCNPATLARDLSYLCEKYEISFIKPYDMFPQIASLETLVCLELKKEK